MPGDRKKQEEIASGFLQIVSSASNDIRANDSVAEVPAPRSASPMLTDTCYGGGVSTFPKPGTKKVRDTFQSASMQTGNGSPTVACEGEVLVKPRR